MASKVVKGKKSKQPNYPIILTTREYNWNVAPPESIALFEDILSRYLQERESAFRDMTESDKILKSKPYIVGLNELLRCLERDELEYVIIISDIPEVMKFHLCQLFEKNNITNLVVFESLNSLTSLFKVKRLSCVGIKRHQIEFGIGSKLVEDISILFHKSSLPKSAVSLTKGKKRKSQDHAIYRSMKIKIK